MAASGPSLESLLDELALASPGVERRAGAGGVEFATRGIAFAAVEAEGGIAFRLRGAVARAALRTPGVVASRRGPDWIVLGPATADRYTRDRATAWFELGRKLAAEMKPPH